MHGFDLRHVVAAALLTSMIVGCSGGTSEALVESREAAQRAYGEALEKVAQKDFAGAKPLLDQAIEAKVLRGDVLAEAYVNRAVCSAATGDFAAAHADLDEMEKGAPNLDEIFAARSYVLQKQGKTREAKQAWTQARRFNRYVKKYSD